MKAVICKSPGKHCAGAGVEQRYLADAMAFEPGQRALAGQFGDYRRRRCRIDRAAHQGHCARRRCVLFGGHQSNRRQHDGRRLADRDDMQIGAQMTDKADQQIDILVQAEIAVAQRRHRHVGPVGDIDVMARQHAAYGAAQKGREMTRHWGDDQHFGGDLGAGPPKVQQIAEWRPDRRFDGHRPGFAVDLAIADFPIRFAAPPQHVLDQLGAGVEGFGEGRQGRRREWMIEGAAQALGHNAHRLEHGALGFVEGVNHRRGP